MENTESPLSSVALTTNQFLATVGQLLCLMPYQRSFAWGKEDLDYIFGEVRQGLSNLMRRPDAIGYLGTILTVHHTDSSNDIPIEPMDRPSRFLSVIDGQQRLSTITLLNVVAHSELTKFLCSNKDSTLPADCELKAICRKMISNLEATFLYGSNQVDPSAPRMMRAFQDTWKKRPSSGAFSSAIAKFVSVYAGTFQNDGADSLSILVKEFESDDLPAYRKMGRFLGMCIDRICGHKSLGHYAANENPADLWEKLAGEKVSEEVRNASNDSNQQHIVDTLKLLNFTEYLNNKVYFTVVTMASRQDIFRIFQAVNTTGVALSAYDTFVAEVVEAVGIANFQKSVTREYFNTVDSYLEHFEEQEGRKCATNSMLTLFALSENGTKLGNNVEMQRTYLRSRIQDSNNLESLVSGLAITVNFLSAFWRLQSPDQSQEFANLNEEAKMGFALLFSLDHTIALGPLVIFYKQLLVSFQRSGMI